MNHSQTRTPPKADDGRILDVKEGVVLDRDGSILTDTAHESDSESPFGSPGARRPGVHVVRIGGGSGLGSLLAFLLFPLALMAGVTTLGIVLAAVICLWLLWTILKPVFRLLSR